MLSTSTFETSTKRPSPRWEAARRFARALVSQGFLARTHFIDRIAERGLGSGIRFDPRTFPSEFVHAAHYRQTRPGYNTRIAVVRGVPILYRTGGRSGKQIVLTGALPPGVALPPSERIAAPRQREVESPESEIPEEGEFRRRSGRSRATPRRVASGRGPVRPRPSRPMRPRVRPIYPGGRLIVVSGGRDGSGGGPDEILRLLIRAKTAMSQAAFDERERRDRKSTERSLRLALDVLRRVPLTWRSAVEGPLEEALNSLARLNNPERFRTFITRALTRIREAMEDRKSYLGR